MKWFAILLVTLSAAAVAQISPEEAMRRLEERKAQQQAAREEIVQITAGELADLRAELLSLRAELARLQATTQPALPAPAPVAAAARPAVDPAILRAIRDRELVPGMTLEQAERALGAKARKLEVTAEGQRVEWNITKSNGAVMQTQEIEAWFKNGLLARTTYRTGAAVEVQRRTIGVGAAPK